MKRALILSSGGTGGAWQAGVIDGLADKGVTFDEVYGTSGGALTGCMLSYGLPLLTVWHAIADSAKGFGKYKYIASPRSDGFLKLNPLEDIIYGLIKNKEQVIRGTFSCVNRDTGNTRVTRTNFSKLVVAVGVTSTCAVPAVFEPYMGKYIDGGVKDILLTHLVDPEEFDEIYILSTHRADVEPNSPIKKFPKKLLALWRAIEIMFHHMIAEDRDRLTKKYPEKVTYVEINRDYEAFGFNRKNIDALYELGREQAGSLS